MLSVHHSYRTADLIKAEQACQWVSVCDSSLLIIEHKHFKLHHRVSR